MSADIEKQLSEELREFARVVVQLAIVRHGLIKEEDDEFDMFDVADDAANAAFGIETCDEEPIPGADGNSAADRGAISVAAQQSTARR